MNLHNPLQNQFSNNIVIHTKISKAISNWNGREVAGPDLRSPEFEVVTSPEIVRSPDEGFWFERVSGLRGF